MSDKAWSIWLAPTDATPTRRVISLRSFEDAERALEQVATYVKAGERYEIRELIDGEWVTHLVAKCQFIVMTPEEAYGNDNAYD